MLGLSLIGCASRQKEVHESKNKWDFNSKVDSSFSFTTTLQTDKELVQQQQSSFSNMSIEYEGEAGDSLIIEETGPDGRTTKTTIRGKGKGSINKGESASTSLTKEKTTTSQDTQFEASGEKELSLDAETSQKDKQVKSTGLSGSVALWIVLIILILVARWLWSRKTGGI